MVVSTLMEGLAESDDISYFQEVLQLESGQTDLMIEDGLKQEAKNLGFESNTVIPTKEHLDLSSSRESHKDAVSIDIRPLSSYSHQNSLSDLNSEISSDISKCESQEKIKPDFSLNKQEGLLRLQDYTPVSFIPNQLRSTQYTLTKYQSCKKLKSCLHIIAFKPRRKHSHQNLINPCVRCRKVCEIDHLQTLICRHTYCRICLRKLIMKASKTEFKIFPMCCSRLIPETLIETVLEDEEQIEFLHNILRFRAQWKPRTAISDLSCRETVGDYPVVNSTDSNEEFCIKCNKDKRSHPKTPTGVQVSECVFEWASGITMKLSNISSRGSHGRKSVPEEGFSGNHLKEDFSIRQQNQDLDRAHNLEIRTQNFDAHQSELERLSPDENTSLHETNNGNFYNEIVKENSWRLEETSEKILSDCVQLSDLRARQINERDRFRAFERKMIWFMLTRQGEEKVKALREFEEQIVRLKEHHALAVAQLEDKQVADEMELRSDLGQDEKSVLIRLRHMEAYCDATGHNTSESSCKRIVTERDLRQLGQQYNIRDSMQRLHQSKIKVMRDKQAFQIEKLIAQQERELSVFMTKNEDIVKLEQRFQEERDKLSDIFAKRRVTLQQKWMLQEQIERRRLLVEKNIPCVPATPPIKWSDVELKM